MNINQKIVGVCGILILGLMTLIPPVNEVEISQDTSDTICAKNVVCYRFLTSISSIKYVEINRLFVQYGVTLVVMFSLILLLKTRKPLEHQTQSRTVKQHPVDEIIYKDT